MPRRVRRNRGIDVARNETEVRGRELPLVGHAIRIAECSELLEMRDVADVDLRFELATDRFLERLAGLEIAARKRPASRERFARALPDEHFETACTHLEDDA